MSFKLVGEEEIEDLKEFSLRRGLPDGDMLVRLIATVDSLRQTEKDYRDALIEIKDAWYSTSQSKEKCEEVLSKHEKEIDEDGGEEGEK